MKHSMNMMCAAKYIVCGMLIGSALGTFATVMMKSGRKHCTVREKAADVMDTVSTIIENIADFTR